MDGAQAKLIEGEVTRETALAPRPADTLPAVQDSGAMFSLLERIITDPNMSMERVNQAFDFYQRVDAAQAKKAFDAAMAAAKAEFEPIIKRHVVDQGAGKPKFKHEDLADIAEAVGPALSRNGLSYRYRATSNINEPITVTCVVTHKAGYAEETTLKSGADAGPGRNSIQAMASALTYLQRYTLRLALGIAAGRDNDGNGADGSEPITEKQVEDLQRLIIDAEANLAKFLDWAGVDHLSKVSASKFQACVDMLEAKRKKLK